MTKFLTVPLIAGDMSAPYEYDFQFDNAMDHLTSSWVVSNVKYDFETNDKLPREITMLIICFRLR